MEEEKMDHSGDGSLENYQPVIHQTPEGQVIIIAPCTYVTEPAQSNSDVIITKSSQTDTVPMGISDNLLDKTSEHSYTKQTIESRALQPILSNTQQHSSYVISNGNIILQEDSRSFVQGPTRSLLSSSSIRSIPKSPQGSVSEHGKRVSLSVPKTSLIKNEPRSPKKIVRLFNPANGNKTFVITTQGQTKKPTFIPANPNPKTRIPPKTNVSRYRIQDQSTTPSASRVRPQSKVRLFHTNPTSQPGFTTLTPQGLATASSETAKGVIVSNGLTLPPTLPGINSLASDVYIKAEPISLSNTSPATSTSVVVQNQSTSVTSCPIVQALVGSNAPSTLTINSSEELSPSGISPPTIQRVVLTSMSSNTSSSSVTTKSISHVKLTSLKATATSTPIVTPSVTKVGFDPGPTDDSLTNIQWLGKMSGQNLSVKEKDRLVTKNTIPLPTFHIVQTEHHVDKVGKECGVNKRPPYSYMHLIQMAINSKVDKRMTLKEIYKWIEDKFPYYGSSTKQGWKNSIRHNLSLYKIFVREKPGIPGKSGTSYWTLQDELANKLAKHIRQPPLSTRPTLNTDRVGTTFLPHVFTTPQSSTTDLNAPTMIRPRKGPAPLLPKPPALSTSLQTFALIPIPAGVSVVPQSPVVVSSWPVTTPVASHSTSTTMSLSNISASSLNSSMKRTHLSDMETEPVRKHVRIAPKASILDKSSTRRIRTTSSSNSSSSMDTAELQSQFSQIHMDSGIASDLSVCDNSSTLLTPTSRTPIMPRPTLSRHKRSRKDKVVVLRDCDEDMTVHCIPAKDSSKENRPIEVSSKYSPSAIELLKSSPLAGHHLQLSLNESAFSESGFNDLLASMEKDFTSPMKGLLITPTKMDSKSELLRTPVSKALLSPSWISPIKNVTPSIQDSRGIDGGFFTPDGKLTSTPNGGLSKMRSRPSNRVCGIKSPKLGSLRDLGLPGLTPLKFARAVDEDGIVHPEAQASPDHSLMSNQSFQRLLGDLNLDSIMEDGVDLGNLSFLHC